MFTVCSGGTQINCETGIPEGVPVPLTLSVRSGGTRFRRGDRAKRTVDIVLGGSALALATPAIAVAGLAVWLEDRKSPLYLGVRSGRGGVAFPMVKLRSMVILADTTRVTSTAADDARITRVGQVIRRFKVDELPQLWNVVVGDMSLVGPRPNVPDAVATYTRAEQELLTVRPGITDFASIVYSDEGEILRGYSDPDGMYEELIRPGKSKLGLFYIQNQSTRLDICILVLTLLSAVSSSSARRGVGRVLGGLGAPTELVELTNRAALSARQTHSEVLP